MTQFQDLLRNENGKVSILAINMDMPEFRFLAEKNWKEIFGKEFPTVDEEEAKNFSKALSEGSLKIGSTGALSTTAGSAIGASKGFFNGISQD